MFVHPLFRKPLLVLIPALLVTASDAVAAPVVPSSAVSRKIHGSTAFDVALPLTGIAGIECRGTSNNHQMVMDFATSVTVTSATVTTGVGTVNDYTVTGSTVTVNLTGVANEQKIVIKLAGVSDGTISNDVMVPMNVLLGDTTANGAVNASDKSQTQGQSGQPVSASNFRTDVNFNGVINASDKGVVQSKAGTQTDVTFPKPNQLASGAGSASLFLQSNGVLSSWGPIPGDGSPQPRSYPSPLTVLANVISASAGNSHAVALAGNAVVSSWGVNQEGQLGDGTTTSRYSPVPVLSNVISVKGGGFHTLALLQDGTVASWGKNNFGQLGNSSTTNSLSPVPVGSLTGVTQIAAGYERSLALKSDGTLWSWGFEAGSPNVSPTVYDTVPTQVAGLSNVITMATGMAHAVAVKGDGTVWAWGNNSSGELGNGSTNYSATPVQVSIIANAKAVSASYDHTLALLADGTVWAWGSNTFGQLGNGTTNFTNVAIQVNGLTNVVAIVAAESYSMALKSDGTVWAWGQAGTALGLALTANVTTSQQVTLGFLDQDANGLDDRWEVQYFGNIGVDPNADPDGDGLTNAEEAYLGTDPTRTQPVPPRFAIINILPTNSSAEGYPTSLNNRGQVALFLDSTPARWTAGVMEQLGLGDDVTDLEFQESLQISDSGAVVGTAFGEPFIEDDIQYANPQPAVWLPGSTTPFFLPVPEIPELGVDQNGGVGLKIATTAAGDVIFGWTINQATDPYGRPGSTRRMIHRWDDPDSQPVLLPGQDGQFQVRMHVWDVNSAGVMAGRNGDGQYFAGGSILSWPPSAINTAGHVAGGWDPPFFWDGTTKDLPRGGLAVDLNDGDVVVGYSNDYTASMIWLWDPETSVFVAYDLLKWLRVTLGPTAAPISLTDVVGINNGNCILVSAVMPNDTTDKPRLLLPVEIKQLNYPTSTDTTDMGPVQEKVISAGGVVYLTGAPEMPRLEARIGNGAIANMTVEWRLEVKSERTERGTKDDHRLPQTDETDVVELSIDQPWKIYDYYIAPADFFGGKCSVYYRIKGASGYLAEEQKFEFKIRGKNPKDADAKAHIQGTQGVYRLAWAMAQHESRQGNRVYNQFNSGGDGPGNLELPNFGPPDGWGIAQLDTPLGVSASTSEVYSWRNNAMTFYLELAEKQATQQRFFNAVAAAYPSNSEAQAPPTSFTHPGTSTTMTALEAGTVTLYNGAGGCPTTTLGGTTYQNPWTFDPNRPSGQKWRYDANSYNYLYKVIHDEFEGTLTTQE
jgi:alpha-tubulin suppressor-like RCC1 family protein